MLPGAVLYPLFQRNSALVPSKSWDGDGTRVITCGYSQIQKIGGGTSINVWQPSGIEERYKKLDGIEWAAIRQVEILQEGSHIELWEMKAEHLWESFKFFNAGRARGYRLAIVIAGVYKKKTDEDHLSSFDRELRDRLQNMAGMLWLDKLGEIFTKQLNERPNQTPWTMAKSLPHVNSTLSAIQIFRRDKSNFLEQVDHQRRAQDLFAHLETLSTNKVPTHDVMVGLKLPQHQSDHDIDWTPAAEFSRMAFVMAIKSVFNTFNLDCGSIHHPRAYGEHMNHKKEVYYAPTHG